MYNMESPLSKQGRREGAVRSDRALLFTSEPVLAPTSFGPGYPMCGSSPERPFGPSQIFDV